VIIIDEAAHIDPKLFYKTIVPILAMKNTSLLCLSSPEGDSNYYSALMNLKRDDNPNESFFRVLQCQQICAECQKLDRVLQIACTHVRNNAHWLSSRKMRELRTLYKANPEDAIREFGGIVVSDSLPAFRKEEIARVFASPPYEAQTPPPYVFVCCDPSGGGPSMMSIVSGYYTGIDTVVVSFWTPRLLAEIEYFASHHELKHTLRHVAFSKRRVKKAVHQLSQMY
jgi:hypothetical protein